METMTAKELSEQTFEGIKLNGPYGKLLGEIELSAIGLIWGKTFSGKSTLALGLANAMADFGRVEYIPAEEHFGITLTQKVNRLKAYNDDLHFRRYNGLSKLKKALKDVKAKVVFLDSVSVMAEKDDDVISFAQWCREQKMGMWMINHANKDGSYKGNSKFGHEADIKIEVENEESGNMAHVRKNRYGQANSIAVPFEAKKRKARSKKKKRSAKKKDDFDSTMNEIEQMMQSA